MLELNDFPLFFGNILSCRRVSVFLTAIFYFNSNSFSEGYIKGISKGHVAMGAEGLGSDWNAVLKRITVVANTAKGLLILRHG